MLNSQGGAAPKKLPLQGLELWTVDRLSDDARGGRSGSVECGSLKLSAFRSGVASHVLQFSRRPLHGEGRDRLLQADCAKPGFVSTRQRLALGLQVLSSAPCSEAHDEVQLPVSQRAMIL
jgi:hypothetical protein